MKQNEEEECRTKKKNEEEDIGLIEVRGKVRCHLKNGI